MTRIEKVARALYLDLYPHDLQFEDWKDMKSSYMQSARAAIEAMREPPDDVGHKFEMHYTGYEALWRTMIDTALKEE